jgi:sulfopyruvate decarboxylase alpha subunit
VSWPDEIHAVFGDLAVEVVAYVPDAGHRRLIEACHADPAIHAVALTTEEEGVALLAGAWLGGARGALLLQSSGVGNCVNMLSLVQECRVPLLVVVTMRGQWGETNPWQVPMGRMTGDVLELCGVGTYAVEDPAQVGPTVAAAGGMAFTGNRAMAVLIGQRLIGAKQFHSEGPSEPSSDRAGVRR